MNLLKSMFKPTMFILATTILVTSFGCEITKKIIGTSTDSIEKARINAISKVYHCNHTDCFNAVLSLTRRQPSGKPWRIKPTTPDEGVFDVFLKDRYAPSPYIIVMGISGSVDTTEVGVFFDRQTKKTIKIDISSLSSIAKRKVAELVFKELDEQFEIAK